MLNLLFGLQEGIDFLAKHVGFLDQFLGLLAIVPEALARHQGIHFRQAFLRFGDVKETSASGRLSRRRWQAELWQFQTWPKLTRGRTAFPANNSLLRFVLIIENAN